MISGYYDIVYSLYNEIIICNSEFVSAGYSNNK
jgi:hypothetical protein